MIYVAGMCYVHARAGDFRIQRVAFLNIMYVIGIASTAHSVHKYNKAYVVPREDGLWQFANHPIAYHFFAYSGAAIIVLLVNFLLNGRLYNGKAIMDNKLSLANGKNDNFKSTLGMPVIQGIAEKPAILHQLKVVKFLLSSKLTGGMLFNSLFVGLVFFTQRTIFTGENADLSFIIFYMVLVGLLFGYVASFFIQMKWIFIPGTFLHVVLMIIALAMYTTENYIATTIFLWLFYIIAGVCYVVPDNALMETSPLSYYEAFAGIGYCFEGVPLMIGAFKINDYFPPTSTHLWISAGIAMAGLLLAAVGMIFTYPNTFRRGHIDIQYMLIYPNKDINIRPVQPPTHDTVTVDLDYRPTQPSTYPPPPPPAANGIEKPSITPVQPPSVPDVPYPEVVPSTSVPTKLPYPEVQTPSVGIQGATANGDASKSLYPLPPADDGPRTAVAAAAVIETTDMYPEKFDTNNDK